jgi:hypothetical protein
MKRSASGMQSHAVGSNVPVQSNSSRKRLRSRRGEFAPWLITAGWMLARRFSRTYRNAAPFGAHTHLCRLPV